MNRIAMSAAASALLRALIARAGVTSDRILLTEVHSTDWQSLTFMGERHRLQLRVTGPCSTASWNGCAVDSKTPNSPFPDRSSPTST